MHRTQLYDAHVAAGARMVDFVGWNMPINYGSQLDEHRAVARAVDHRIAGIAGDGAVHDPYHQADEARDDRDDQRYLDTEQYGVGCQ